MPLRCTLAGLALLALCALPAPAAARDVVLVANAEGGTVSIVDARTFVVLRELNVLPDGREADASENPAQALVGQRIVEAAGGTNFAQDQDISPDGRTLYVSRGHRGDVAAFDFDSGELRWKVPISGLRADHMTISPDGARLYVSALTADRVEVVDTAEHRVIGSFATGEWPHDNHLSHDGAHLYNGSIGNVVTPWEAREERSGVYRLTIADPQTLEVQRTLDFDRGIRPYVITNDERRLFAQLSEFHGIVEVDLATGEHVRELELPIDDGVTEEDYDFEAPHHGLAMSPDEQTLCAAGRASDYVALVSTRTLTADAIIDVGDAPGWAANGPDGEHCFVPNTREDTLSVISYAQRAEVARIPVGDGPKQIEPARLPEQAVAPRLHLVRRCVRGGALRVELRGDLGPVQQVAFRLGRRTVARDREAPFARTVARRKLRRTRSRQLHARATVMGEPNARVLTRTLPRCGLRR